MSLVQAFNSLLKAFVDDLLSLFPAEPGLRLFSDGFDALVTIDPSKPMTAFMDSVAPHSQKLVARDASLFDVLALPGGTVNFKALWASDISDEDRNAIWQYLHNLYTVGTLVSSLPPEMMHSIEAMATQCAEKLQNGQLDFGSLLGMLAGMTPPDVLSSAGGQDTLDENETRRSVGDGDAGTRRRHTGHQGRRHYHHTKRSGHK